MINNSSSVLKHPGQGIGFPDSDTVSPETVQILQNMMRINRHILCNRTKGLYSEAAFLRQLDANHWKELVIDETLKDRTRVVYSEMCVSECTK